ncbi:MAG: cation-translocating P-type ATPase, partial [Clostridia bacterium]
VCHCHEKTSDNKEVCHCHENDGDSKANDNKENCHCNKKASDNKVVDGKTSDKKEVCHCHESGKEKQSETSSCCASSHKPSAQVSACGCGGEHSSQSACGCGGLHSDGGKRANMIMLAKILVSLGFLILGFLDWHSIGQNVKWLMVFHYFNPAWIAVVLCGIPIFAGAINSLANKKITASVLISVAMLSAIVLEIVGFFYPIDGDGGHTHSYVFVAGEVAFLMAIGGAIEDWTVGKTKAGIARLVGLIPKEAFVKVGDKLEKRSLADIKIGDIVVAKAGEMIAVDGEIISGSSSVDVSSVTGEYVPAELTVGDKVYGGTFSKTGAIEIRVEKLLQDMTIAKMAELVEEAQGKKAPISRVADRWASVIVPTAIGLSIVVGLVAGLAFKTSVVEAIIRSITVLIVFCPCSLALATPTAIAAGLGNSARNGVLVKSGASLEVLSKADTICFDKTGTLTEGALTVCDIVVDGVEENELLKLCASVENYSEHPLAAAVARKAEGLGIYQSSDIEILQGVGVVGKANGKEIKLLSFAQAVKSKCNLDKFATQADELLAQGKTLVVALVDGATAGLLAFSDTIRQDARQVIDTLNKGGYATIMLTGDNEKSARYVAEKCGIQQVKFGLLPQEKLQVIKDLQAGGHKVCMVGDGINDAPSLKLADCSLAMGALGSDIAIETADMAILNSDMNKIVDTLALSKRALGTIKRNIILAMSINLVAIILSMFGILTPMSGAIVHNVTSILVVLSSAMLLRKGKSQKKQFGKVK